MKILLKMRYVKRAIDDDAWDRQWSMTINPMRGMKPLQELAADRANSRRFINLRSNRDLARAPIKCQEAARRAGDEGRSAEGTVYRFSRRVLVKNWPDVFPFDTRMVCSRLRTVPTDDGLFHCTRSKPNAICRSREIACRRPLTSINPH